MSAEKATVRIESLRKDLDANCPGVSLQWLDMEAKPDGLSDYTWSSMSPAMRRWKRANTPQQLVQDSPFPSPFCNIQDSLWSTGKLYVFLADGRVFYCKAGDGDKFVEIYTPWTKKEEPK